VTAAVVAAEPSAVMIAQRLPGAASAVQARAVALPFADRAFEDEVVAVWYWSDEGGAARLRMLCGGSQRCRTFNADFA
jgi:hypothetical protein